MATASVAEKFLAWLRSDPSDTQPLPEVGEATMGNASDLRRWGAAGMISEALSGAVTLQTLGESPEDLSAIIHNKDKLTVVGIHEKNSSRINFDWAFSGFDVLKCSFHPTTQLLGERAVCSSVVVQDALHQLATLEAIPQDSLPEGLRLVAWQFAIICNSVTSAGTFEISEFQFCSKSPRQLLQSKSCWSSSQKHCQPGEKTRFKPRSFSILM